jgi:hypothetical protein
MSREPDQPLAEVSEAELLERIFADDDQPAAWRAYLDHATACDACREVEAGCEKGKELRHAWRSSRGEAGR